MTTTAVRPPPPTTGEPPETSRDRPPDRRPRRGLPALVRRLRLRTVPGKVRVISFLALVAVVGLFGAAAVAVNNARDGLKVIGHSAGPQVVATGDLLFALSDMDAQVADILLIGREQNLGTGRQAALARYEQRRAEAGRALLQAAQLAGDDATEQRTVRLVIEGLGRYERLAAQAMLLDTQAAHAAGPPPQRVIALHRQATDLMKVELLPKAYNLTLDSGTTVRSTYEAKHAAVDAGRIWVLGTGAIVLVILLILQVYLARRFRRLLNPALALATLTTIGIVVAAVFMLGGQADHLKTAKRDGFDSILALSRARAISNSAYADQSRFLLDPGRADTYEQIYFDKVQSVLFIDTTSLDAYHQGLAPALGKYSPGQRGDPGFLGFFGDEARNVRTPEQRGAVGRVLSSYQQFQRDDQQMRGLVAGGKRTDAIRLRMGRAVGGSIHDFEEYDRSLTSLIKVHRGTFDDSIKSGDDGLNGWNWLLPGVSVGLAVLILAGVRPRLAEYR